MTSRVALGLCLIPPPWLARRASLDLRPSPAYRQESAKPSPEAVAWTHLDDALPLMERAEPTAVGILAYQVTIAAAAANCRGPVESPPASPREADLLARRVYTRLSCSPVPIVPTHRSWADPKRRLPIGRQPPTPQPLTGIEAAIERGAEVTGVSADYLKRTAIAESGLRPTVSAQTSSAQGLYQFLAGTWLVTVHRYGSELGLSRAASEIEIDASGRARVTNPDARAAILALRSDPLVSTAMAGMLTRENAVRLTASGLGSIDGANLYAAHVLGAHGAAVLRDNLLHQPQDRATRIFAAAVSSNPALFHAHGPPLSVAGLVQVLRRKVGD